MSDGLEERVTAIEERLGMEAGLRAAGDRDQAAIGQTVRPQHHLIQALAITLLDVLAPDVVLVADGGGVVSAARHPIKGGRRVAALLAGLARMPFDLQLVPMWLNGGLAVRIDLDGELDTVTSLVIEDGRITRMYSVRNPHKLARLHERAELSLGSPR